MRENCKGMSEEIAKIVWHPSRMSRWPEDDLFDDIGADSENESDYDLDSIPITSTIRAIKISIKLRS
jgi:hypothetical protein